MESINKMSKGKRSFPAEYSGLFLGVDSWTDDVRRLNIWREDCSIPSSVCLQKNQLLAVKSTTIFKKK